MPIIILSPGEACSTQRVVALQLDYGLIVSNGDTNCAPHYNLFCRNEKKIVMSQDAKAFLSELDALPDGATVDLVSKCNVPFYTQHGVDITNEYNSIMAVLHRKRARLVSSLEDDRRHASFCYCGSCITILEKYEAEPQGEPKHVSSAEFKREFELRNAQTMVWSEYLGEKDGKVFLRRKTMSWVNKMKWNEEIWFTETRNLDAVFLGELKKEVPNQATQPTGSEASPQSGR